MGQNAGYSQLNNLDVFERQLLWRICGPIQGGSLWRSRYNHELYTLYKEPKFTATVRIAPSCWGGHVQCMEQMSKRLLQAKISGKMSVKMKSGWLDKSTGDTRKLRIRLWWRRVTETPAGSQDSSWVVLLMTITVFLGLYHTIGYSAHKSGLNHAHRTRHVIGSLEKCQNLNVPSHRFPQNILTMIVLRILC